jgi:hypothetical protein
MELRFTYTGDDFDEVFSLRWSQDARLYRRRRVTNGITLALMVIALGLVIWFRVLAPRITQQMPWIPSGHFDWHDNDLYAISVAVGSSVAFVIYYFARRRRKLGEAYLKSQPMSQQPQVMVIGDVGIDVSSPLNSSQYRWESFTDWMESDGIFALRLTGRHGILVIPRRSATDEQQAELREVFKRRIVTPTGGFPITLAEREKEQGMRMQSP